MLEQLKKVLLEEWDRYRLEYKESIGTSLRKLLGFAEKDEENTQSLLNEFMLYGKAGEKRYRKGSPIVDIRESILFGTLLKPNQIKKAKSLKDLGLTFAKAIEILLEKGVKVVLSKKDLANLQNAEEYTSPSDPVLENKYRYINTKFGLILVTKTNDAPRNSNIYSPRLFSVKQIIEILTREEKFKIKFESSQDIVPFTLNSESNSQKNKKYAVLIPFFRIKDDPYFLGGRPDYVYFQKYALIPQHYYVSTDICGFILCPEAEMEHLQDLNEGVLVIGYKGDSVDGYATAFLTMLGYKPKEISKDGWLIENDLDKADYYETEAVLSDDEYLFHEYEGSYEQKLDDLLGAHRFTMGIAKAFKDYFDNFEEYDVHGFLCRLFKGENIVKKTVGNNEETTNLKDFLKSMDCLFSEYHLLEENWLFRSYEIVMNTKDENSLTILKSKLAEKLDIDISLEEITSLAITNDEKIQELINISQIDPRIIILLNQIAHQAYAKRKFKQKVRTKHVR
ncbi:MAG: hypothetical protein GX951_03725 [Mollicutes bacterium]|nr:hypothetical protein [Mollicutes bacterium]